MSGLIFTRDGRTLPYVPVTIAALEAIRKTCSGPRPKTKERRSYPHALATYMALLEMANAQRGNRVAISQKRLAAHAGCSRESAWRALGDLEAAGVLKSYERPSNDLRGEKEYVVIEPGQGGAESGTPVAESHYVVSERHRGCVSETQQSARARVPSVVEEELQEEPLSPLEQAEVESESEAESEAESTASIEGRPEEEGTETSFSPAKPKRSRQEQASELVEEAWARYREVFHDVKGAECKNQLDTLNAKALEEAIQMVGIEKVKQALSGLKRSDWNMGKNPGKKIYVEPRMAVTKPVGKGRPREVNLDRIERMAALATPKTQRKGPAPEKRLQSAKWSIADQHVSGTSFDLTEEHSILEACGVTITGEDENGLLTFSDGPPRRSNGDPIDFSAALANRHGQEGHKNAPESPLEVEGVSFPWVEASEAL